MNLNTTARWMPVSSISQQSDRLIEHGLKSKQSCSLRDLIISESSSHSGSRGSSLSVRQWATYGENRSDSTSGWTAGATLGHLVCLPDGGREEGEEGNAGTERKHRKRRQLGGCERKTAWEDNFLVNQCNGCLLTLQGESGVRTHAHIQGKIRLQQIQTTFIASLKKSS